VAALAAFVAIAFEPFEDIERARESRRSRAWRRMVRAHGAPAQEKHVASRSKCVASCARNAGLGDESP
jgi:hypothetical protein